MIMGMTFVTEHKRISSTLIILISIDILKFTYSFSQRCCFSGTDLIVHSLEEYKFKNAITLRRKKNAFLLTALPMTLETSMYTIIIINIWCKSCLDNKRRQGSVLGTPTYYWYQGGLSIKRDNSSIASNSLTFRYRIGRHLY